MKMKIPYIKYFASLLMFGMNGVVASHIALTSYEIVFSRTLIGSLMLTALFALSRRRPRFFKVKKHALFLAASGAAMGTSWMFLYEAYRHLGVGIASLAYYCGPVIMMVLSPVLFGENLTWPKLAGFFTVAAGMLCVNAQALGEGETAWGLLCGVLSAVTYALMVIFNKKASSITGLENAMWQLLSAFLTVSVFIGLRQGFAIDIRPESWPPILILGVVNTGIGCYFYFSSIGSLPVQTVAICSYIEPLSALVFSALLLYERMSPLQIAGSVLILGGAAFGEMFRPRVKTDAL